MNFKNLFINRRNRWQYAIMVLLAAVVIVGIGLIFVITGEEEKRLVPDRTDTRTEKEGTKGEGETQAEADSEGWPDTGLEETKLQNFLVEDYADLHIGEPFQIENYYITNLSLVGSYFFIDEEGTLWGCGANNCGQLGIGRKTTYLDTPDGSVSIEEPQKIAENVVHVDASNFSGSFTIFLTEDRKLYGMGANMNGLMGMDVPEEFNYLWNPDKTTADLPVLLMEDVRYARCATILIALV